MDGLLKCSFLTSNKCVYLLANHSNDDVLVVSAAPAQDVGALFVALLTQLVAGILRTGNRRNIVTVFSSVGIQ